MAGRDDERVAEPTFDADGTGDDGRGPPGAFDPPVVPRRPAPPAASTRLDEQPPRPRIEEEPSILGLTRHSNSRLGARLFTLFFVLIYAVIVIQLVVALVGG